MKASKTSLHKYCNMQLLHSQENGLGIVDLITLLNTLESLLKTLFLLAYVNGISAAGNELVHPALQYGLSLQEASKLLEI